jgi:hypothetical protein
MTPEMETSAAKLFALMDANGNGFVVEKELQRHLSLAGISLAKDRTVLPSLSKNFQLFQQKNPWPLVCFNLTRRTLHLFILRD